MKCNLNSWQVFSAENTKTLVWGWDCQRQALANNKYIKDIVDEYYKQNNNVDSKWYEIDAELEEECKFIFDFTGRYFLEWLDQIDFTKPLNIISLNESDIY